MKKLLLCATPVIAALALLNTPASAESSGDTAGASRAANAMYCWKDKLQVNGSTLLCNWADNVEEACKGNPMTDLSKDVISNEPTNAKRCNNGQWLIQVTRK